MPLAKKTKSDKGNQGAQWGSGGSAGNIKNLPESGGTDKSGKKPMVSGKRGRNLSIGRR
jgi:hypothetical protein